MAKIEGTQDIPSELLDLYRGNLLDGHPGNVIRKRYPYRLKRMQEGGPGVHAKQKTNRERFKKGIALFRKTTPTERQRWYATMPAWKSLLWYYNWFMLSVINDQTKGLPKGGGMLKQIINTKFACPAGGTNLTWTQSVDVGKAVVMLWGGAHSTDYEFYGEEGIALVAWNIFPVWDSFVSTGIGIGWAETPIAAANVCLQIIEYV